MGDHIEANVTPDAAQKPADLEGLVQHARLRARMFDTPREYPILDRYEVHEQLGKGGMGEVYKAWDPELQRFVAIKLMQTGLGEEARERLRREAQAMARIEHNHVVRVYDTGTWRGRLFVVMEYIEGTTLREWRESEERSARQILDAYVQAGKGLARIHQDELVHRDFKPDNVMLDDHDRVVVGDLGLVHVSRPRIARDEATAPGTAESDEHTPDEDQGTWLLARTLTRDGARVGTLRYMSPEQFRGQETDARSDQFSFCVALYEALYQTMPFPGESEAELAESVLAGAIRPRPAKHGVPGWLDTVVTRGLAVDPDARFADMPSLLRELARRERRRKLAFGGTALVALAVLPALFATQMLTTSNTDRCASIEDQRTEFWSPERQKAIETHIRASGPPDEAGSAWKRFEQSFESALNTWEVTKLESCQNPRDERIERKRAHCLEDNRRWMRKVSGIYAATEIAPRDLKHVYETVRALRGRDDCADDEELMRGMALPEDKDALQAIDEVSQAIEHAHALELAGQYDQARTQAEEVVTQTSELAYWPVRARAMYRLGHVLGSERNGEAADEALSRAYDFALLANQPGLAGEIATYRAKVAADDLRDIPRGREALIQAESTLVQAGRAPVPGVALSEPASVNLHHADLLEARGLVELNDDEPEAARDAHHHALAIRRKLALGAPDLYVSKSLNNLGNALSELGESERAIEHYEEALGIRQTLLGREHPLVSEVLHNLGDEHHKQGEFKKARQELGDALAIDTHTHGPDHPGLLPILVAWSNLEIHKLQTSGADPGDDDELQRACVQIRGIHEGLEPHQRKQADRAPEYAVLGACEQYSGELGDALDQHIQAMYILESRLDEAGVNVLDYADALYNVAEVLAEMRDKKLVRAKHARHCARLVQGLERLPDEDDEFQYAHGEVEKACGPSNIRPRP